MADIRTPELSPPNSGLRGSGRTYKMIEALPDGGRYVILSMSHAGEMRQMLEAQGRRTNAVHFVPYDESCVLRELSSNMVAVDHYVWEKGDAKHLMVLRGVLDGLHPRALYPTESTAARG